MSVDNGLVSIAWRRIQSYAGRRERYWNRVTGNYRDRRSERRYESTVLTASNPIAQCGSDGMESVMRLPGFLVMDLREKTNELSNCYAGQFGRDGERPAS